MKDFEIKNLIKPLLSSMRDFNEYHVKKQLELLDQLVGPSSIILLHDLMYGNTEPFYHSDLSHAGKQWDEGGPYRAVAELNPQ